MRLGLFDSGVGGLTVLRAIRSEFPNADLVYLGDTARVPYGIKSARSIERYAQQATRCLQVEKQIDALIIACNTASALATAPLRDMFPALEVFSVIEPGAQEAVNYARAEDDVIGVMATESTVNGGAYTRSIQAKLPRASVVGQACQMLVSVAEEGWVNGKVAELCVERYLSSLKDRAGGWPSAVVLGCTHFPLLHSCIRRVADSMGGGDMRIVDSSTAIALHLRACLGARLASGTGRTEFLATDGAARFARVGTSFLGREIRASDVQIVDLHPYGSDAPALKP